MKIYTKHYFTLAFICAFTFFFASCSKDSDLLLDAVIEKDEVSLEEQDILAENSTEELLIDEDKELRITSFPTTNDAHMESGKGFDQSIIRLEEGNRTSYLMFDLRAIDSINGTIKKATLEFTVESDDGHGPITIYSGKNSNWKEENITQNTAPQTDAELGSLTAEYKVGSTVTVDLLETNLNPEISTLILHQQNGNDFAFASKEHSTKSGPKLVIEYETAIDAAEIDPVVEEEAIPESNTNQEPIAISDASVSTGEAPLAVTFTGSNSTDDTGIVSYAWNFQDGSTSTEANPSHTFETAGTYLVEFTVTDEDGVTDTDVDTITVTEAGNTGGTNSNYPSNAVYASSFGYNASDATEAFKDAINSGNSFIVIDKQNSDWIVKPSKFFNLSNVTIVFEEGVILKAKSGAFPLTSDILFQLVRPTNVTIEGYGAELKMNKSEYTNGEGRHALSIHQGNNVIVKGLTFRDSGGDGIYIAGYTATGSYSEDITIEDILCTNNRRQGMSIISAQDVWVRNSEFSRSNGVSPECGVDLEPNEPEERLVNINFSNCKFTNNDSWGFVIGTNKLNSSSIPISVTVKDSYFSNNSLSPDGTYVKTELKLDQGIHNNPVKGTTTFERLNFDNSNNSIIFSKLASDSFTASFKDCRATNVNKSGSGGVIELQASSVENTLGGFYFGNFYLEYTSNIPFMKILAPNTSGFKVRDITGNFTVKAPNDSGVFYTGGYNSSSNDGVNINFQHIN